MAAIAVTQSDLTAMELRVAAGREKNSAASRRMLALAMVLDEFDKNRFLSGRQFGGPSAGLTIAQTREACRVVTMHPVAQGLAIHAAGLGCARAVSPVENHCKRQHSPRRCAVLLSTGCYAKLHGRQIALGDCNRRHRSGSPSYEEPIDSDF